MWGGREAGERGAEIPATNGSSFWLPAACSYDVELRQCVVREPVLPGLQLWLLFPGVFQIRPLGVCLRRRANEEDPRGALRQDYCTLPSLIEFLTSYVSCFMSWSSWRQLRTSSAGIHPHLLGLVCLRYRTTALLASFSSSSLLQGEVAGAGRSSASAHAAPTYLAAAFLQGGDGAALLVRGDGAYQSAFA